MTTESYIPFDPWIDTILGRLSGAVVEHVETTVRNVLRDFFNDTHVWREMLGPRSIAANKSTYQLTPVDQYRDVQYVLNAWYDLRKLHPKAFRTPHDTESAEEPRFFYSPRPGYITLIPVPTKAVSNALTVEATLTIPDNAVAVPQFMETHFYDAITNGVLARMYAIPDRPYTNLGQAAIRRTAYVNDLGVARSTGKRWFVPAEDTWHYPVQAGGWP